MAAGNKESDVADGGSRHIASTIARLKSETPELLVECLTPDFGGVREDVERVATAGLDVLAHNVETPACRGGCATRARTTSRRCRSFAGPRRRLPTSSRRPASCWGWAR